MKFHACWIQFCHTLYYFYRPHFLQNANNTPFQFVEYSTIPVEISDLPNLQPCQNLGFWLFYNMIRNLKIFTYHKLGGHVDLRPLNGRNALWLVETPFFKWFFEGSEILISRLFPAQNQKLRDEWRWFYFFFSQKENCWKVQVQNAVQLNFSASAFLGELLKNPHIILSMFVGKSLP